MEITNALQQTLESQVENLRRSLKRVISDATIALAQMEAGHRPSNSVSAPVLSSAIDVERDAAKVELLLNWAGSPMLENDAAIQALTGKVDSRQCVERGHHVITTRHNLAECPTKMAPVPDCPACQMGGMACHNHREEG